MKRQSNHWGFNSNNPTTIQSRFLKSARWDLHCSVIYGDGFTEEKLFKRSGPIFSIAQQLCHHPTVSVSSSSEVQQEKDQQRKGIDPFQDQHFWLQAKLKTRGDRTGQDVDESSAGPIRCSSPIGPVYMTRGLVDPSCYFSISSISYTHLATWLISNFLSVSVWNEDAGPKLW